MLGKIKRYWVDGLLILTAYISSYPAFLLVKLGLIKSDGLVFAWSIALLATVGMLVIPIYVIRLQKKDPKHYGFRWPENTKQALTLTLSTIVGFLLILLLYARTDSFREYYLIKHPLTIWFLLEILASFIYFFAEEFFFRGYLLQSLFEKIGKHTLWVTSLIFAALHLGKPQGEMLFAFFAGIILGLISQNTKSFIPAAIIHFTIALGINLIIIFTI